MGEKPEPAAVAKKQVILLDLSMFVLDLISPEKLSDRFKSDDITFEVPSALVTMIWAAKADDDTGGNAGRRLLLDFIAAYLRSIKTSPEHKRSKDAHTVRLIASIERNFSAYLSLAYQRVIEDFSLLIQGGSKSTNDGNPNGRTDYPIGQYEPVLAVSEREQSILRSAYKQDLELDGHPLYDLYFLQVHHAQSIGLAASPVLKRKLIAIGRTTHRAIVQWRQDIGDALRGDEQPFPIDDETLVTEIISTYVKENWKPMLLGFGLDLTLSYLIPGSGLILNVASAFLSTAVPAVVDLTERSTGVPLTNIILILMGLFGFLGVGTFLAGLISPLPPILVTLTPTPVFDPNNIGNFQNLQTPSPISQAQAVLTSTLDFPIVIVNSAAQTVTLAAPSANYCRYVVQSGDTLQSIAEWFAVSEDSIRFNDSNVASGLFKIHQLINVPAACCTHIGNRGFTYNVKRGDTIFRLARNNLITIEQLVLANNLRDARYIQAGQMLCIPNP